MSKLRKGLPSRPAEPLTRARQDGILLECIVDARVVARRMRADCGCTISEELPSFRSALRLDDPVLDDLTARAKNTGRPLQWSEDRAKETA